jgi:hypothetical protein
LRFYLGAEDKEELREELTRAIPVINSLLQITVGDNEYQIQCFLVCDMKCLVRILGLYDVFHPKSHWKCAWCHVDATNIADFSKPAWPLRDIKKMVQQGKPMNGKSEAQQKTFARTHHGITCEPILAFLLEQIVPCFLHITMGITRALLNRLGEQADDKKALADELVERLESSTIGLSLVPESKGDGKSTSRGT